MSGSVSTAVRLNASELSRRSLVVASGGAKVAVPRLIGSAGEGDVEPDLDDAIVQAQNGLAYRNEPRMRRDLRKPANALGLHFDIPSLGPARQGATRHRPRLREQHLDILAQPVGERRTERRLQRHHPVAIDRAQDIGRLWHHIIAGHTRLPSFI